MGKNIKALHQTLRALWTACFLAQNWSRPCYRPWFGGSSAELIVRPHDIESVPAWHLRFCDFATLLHLTPSIICVFSAWHLQSCVSHLTDTPDPIYLVCLASPILLTLSANYFQTRVSSLKDIANGLYRCSKAVHCSCMPRPPLQHRSDMLVRTFTGCGVRRCSIFLNRATLTSSLMSYLSSILVSESNPKKLMIQDNWTSAIRCTINLQCAYLRHVVSKAINNRGV